MTDKKKNTKENTMFRSRTVPSMIQTILEIDKTNKKKERKGKKCKRPALENI